jgi:DNA-binding response OmpR family regulator
MALPLQGCWILVAEDEVLVALDFRMAFEAAGAHVDVAPSLQKAMTLLEQRDWAGAVLDYSLGDGYCTPLCEWCVERQIPFIVCSGYEELSAPCSQGIRMPKPSPSEEIVRTMASLLA